MTKKEFDAAIRAALPEEERDNLGYQENGGNPYPDYYGYNTFDEFRKKMMNDYPEAYKAYDKSKREMGIVGVRSAIPPKMASIASSSRFFWAASRLENLLKSIELNFLR